MRVIITVRGTDQHGQTMTIPETARLYAVAVHAALAHKMELGGPAVEVTVNDDKGAPWTCSVWMEKPKR